MGAGLSRGVLGVASVLLLLTTLAGCGGDDEQTDAGADQGSIAAHSDRSDSDRSDGAATDNDGDDGSGGGGEDLPDPEDFCPLGASDVNAALADFLDGDSVSPARVQASDIDHTFGCFYDLPPASFNGEGDGSSIGYYQYAYADDITYDDDRGCLWGGSRATEVLTSVPECRDDGGVETDYTTLDVPGGSADLDNRGSFVLGSDGEFWYDGGLFGLFKDAEYADAVAAFTTSLAASAN